MGILNTVLKPLKVATKPAAWLVTDHQKIKHNRKVKEMNDKIKKQKTAAKSKVSKVKAKAKAKVKAKTTKKK